MGQSSGNPDQPNQPQTWYVSHMQYKSKWDAVDTGQKGLAATPSSAEQEKTCAAAPTTGTGASQKKDSAKDTESLTLKTDSEELDFLGSTVRTGRVKMGFSV